MGHEIELTSSDRAAASVPPVITIAVGATAGTFRITTALVAAPVNVILTATHATTAKTAALSVVPPAGNYVASLGVVPAFIAGGTTATATVTLAFPSADPGGSDVQLTSSAPAVLGVPPVVKVHGNSTTATFTVTAAIVPEPVAVTVTATYGGVMQRARLVVARENAVTLAGLSVTPERVVGGTTATGRVTLTAPAPFGGAVVAIDAKRRNIVTVPPTVMVPEGATSAVFTIGTELVHGQKERSLELVATYNNTTAATTLTVTPPPATATSSQQRPAALCASMALAPCLTQTALQIATSTSTVYDRQHNLYTPELNLLAETIASPATAPPIAYEYIWFAGQPLAQVNVAANQIHYYFNDHLGTPILQSDATARIVWQVEYEPYGTVYAARRGEAKHQPLRFPGQEAGGNGDLSYNMFRWYRSSWGRYSSVDPLAPGGLGHFDRGRMSRFMSPFASARERFMRENATVSDPALVGMSSMGRRLSPPGLSDATNPYAYAADSPVMYTDPLGLAPCLTMAINPISGYVPAGPPGKTFKGCQYIGYCYGWVLVHEKEVALDCKCKDFCLISIEPATAIPNGPTICFNTPPWWTWSPPLINP